VRSLPFAVLCVLCVSFLALHIWTVRGFYFNNDDVHMLAKGDAALGRLPSLFTPDKAGRIHPVTYALLGTVKRLFGWWPFPAYLLMGLVHVGNVLLAFLVFRRMLQSGTARLIGCAAFLVLSVHFQCVGWIAELGRALSLTFSLVAFGGYLRFRENGNWWCLAFGIAAWWVAFWCSEEAIVLPAVCVAEQFTASPLRGQTWRDWRWLCAFAAAGVAIIGINLIKMNPSQTAGYFQVGWHLPQNLVAFCRETAQALVVPRRELLSWVPVPATVARGAIALSLVTVFAITVWRASGAIRREWSLCLVAATWFLAMLLPFLFRPMGWIPQARYLYAASLGACLAFGFAVDSACRRADGSWLRGPAIGAAIASILLSCGGYVTLVRKNQQKSRWADPAGLDGFVEKAIPLIEQQLGTAPAGSVFFLEVPALDPVRTEPAHLEAALHFYYTDGVRVVLGPPPNPAPTNAWFIRWDGESLTSRRPTASFPPASCRGHCSFR